MKKGTTFLAHHKSNGFTLIELLVVIAIIALLATILFPVFGRARENARRSNCQSNMKQIGLGILQYGQDFDEQMPLLRQNGSCSAPWGELLQPYMKSKQVFRCPSQKIENPVSCSDPNARVFTDYIANGTGYFVGNGTAFSYDRPLDNANWFSPYVFRTTPLAKIETPSQSIMVLEYDSSLNPTRGYGTNLQTVNYANGMWGPKGHMATTNFLFVDGHVKSLKPSATFTSTANMWSINANNVPGGGVGNALRGTLAGVEDRINAE